MYMSYYVRALVRYKKMLKICAPYFYIICKSQRIFISNVFIFTWKTQKDLLHILVRPVNLVFNFCLIFMILFLSVTYCGCLPNLSVWWTMNYEHSSSNAWSSKMLLLELYHCVTMPGIVVKSYLLIYLDTHVHIYI